MLLTNRNALAECPVMYYLQMMSAQTNRLLSANNCTTIITAQQSAHQPISVSLLCHTRSLIIHLLHTHAQGWEGYFLNAIVYRLLRITLVILTLCWLWWFQLYCIWMTACKLESEVKRPIHFILHNSAIIICSKNNQPLFNLLKMTLLINLFFMISNCF